MVIRNRIVSIMSVVFLTLSLSICADPTVEQRLNALETGTFSASLSKAADSFSKGTKAEVNHSLSFKPSMFFGFAACLSLFSAYRGVTNYLYAHKTKYAGHDSTEEKKNRSAAQKQMTIGFAGLLASALGLYWTSK